MTDDLLLRLDALCDDGLTVRALGEQVVIRLRQQIPCDGYVFAATDPVTMVAVSPVADVPMLPWPRLPELIRRRYLAPSRQVDTLLEATSGVWDALLAEIGVVDTAAVGFVDRYGAWGYVELWRTGSHFKQRELDLLGRLSPTMAKGVRGAIARTFNNTTELLVPIGPAVAVLGPDLTLRSQTDNAAATLLQLLPPGEEMAPIPAAAYNVGAALLAHEAG
ncbi:MAG TPA: hypothetical protein VLI04_21345, partial [Nocardioidaceae bacterium]|nr:hypothetical protein [Nocardioidaceae bacterium]